MKKKLDYRELIKSWMLFYGLTVGFSQKLFSSIWKRMKSTETKLLEEGGNKDGARME